MATFKTGDKVRVVTREIKPEDEKSGLYYAYFGGLTGSVDAVYDDGSVCVDVDLESLSEDARERHLAMQEAEKKRWLDGLSGEARGRLNADQKQLRLSYKILTSENDLESFKGGKPTDGKREKSSTSENKASSKTTEPRAAPHSDEGSADESKRMSEEDLTKAEEEYLKSLKGDS